jgi:hypothetical protein
MFRRKRDHEEQGTAPHDQKLLSFAPRSAPSMIGPDGRIYGYEFDGAESSDIDRFTGLFVSRLKNNAPAVRPKVIDLGGGSGQFAERMRRQGCDVVVVDFGDHENEIKQRSTAGKTGAGRIDFIRSDVRDLSADFFRQQAPDLVYARKLIHFLSPRETETLLEKIAEGTRAGTGLALSFDGYQQRRDDSKEKRAASLDHSELISNGANISPAYLHDATEIRFLLKCLDFRIEYAPTDRSNPPCLFATRAAKDCPLLTTPEYISNWVAPEIERAKVRGWRMPRWIAPAFSRLH